ASFGVCGNQHFAAGESGYAEYFLAGGRPGEAAARPGARLDEAFEAEPQGIAVTADGNTMHWSFRSFFLRRDVADDARVQAHRRDHLLAVFQLEEPLDRLAVAR